MEGRCLPIWSKEQVGSLGSVGQGYVGRLLRLRGKPGWCTKFKTVGERVCVKGNWVWAARVRNWRPRSPHGNRFGYLSWLIISSRLFRLNTRAWGDLPHYTNRRSCQDVFKTSSKRLQDVSQKRLKDIFGFNGFKMLNGFKLLTTFEKKAPSQMLH